MVYKEKVLNILEALDGKLRLIENVANGAMVMDNRQVNELIAQTKKLVEQMHSLISIER
ncbi:hypothetical protein UFOVP449_56 [uncultured Caudovirales phage]|uniref:Uncharacterized protein n=1 Tax=uncultured Caudovirales phage TaxID=2100421 RepID=A0A6J5M730_9CAUD|nr:hypothetical protein UFOVP449_56 [uncultured Caudovirales phage]